MPGPSNRQDRVALAAALVVSLAFVLPVLYRGWASFDEGWILEQPLRVLAGQLPHRDYDDMWTGGWSFVHAALFAVAGPSMAVMRTATLVAWLVGLVVLFGVVRRWVSAPVAALAVVVSALWTLWAYQLSSVNWFYFPCAIVAAAAALRADRSGNSRWLAGAGAAAAVAVVMKVTGLYVLAALLLWTVVAAARDARAAEPGVRGDARWIAVVIAIAYAVVSLRLVSRMAGAESAVVLIGGPNVLLSLAVAAAVWRGGAVGLVPFAVALTRRVALLMAGFAVAALPFLAPYIVTGSLGDLINGVFIVPQSRFDSLSFPPPWWRMAVKFSVPIALLWLAVPRATWTDDARTIRAAALIGGAFGAAWVLLPFGPDYFSAALHVIPVALLGAACWALIIGRGAGPSSDVVLLLALAATGQLVQVPYATTMYFLAPVPLVVVAGIAYAASTRPSGPMMRAPIVFALAVLTAAGIVGARRVPGMNDAIRMWGDARVPSGDAMWIPRADSVRYATLIDVVQRARRGGGVYAFPIGNELYYFLGTRSPTRSLIAELAPDDEALPGPLVAKLQAAGVTTVALFEHRGTAGAPRLSSVQQALQAAYPCERWVEQWAEVRWLPVNGSCDLPRP